MIFTTRESFRDLRHTYPDIADYTLRHLATSVRILTERVVEHSSLSAKVRIYIELIRLARDESDVLNGNAVIRSTHTDIAHKVSTTREAVTREIAGLTTANILEKRGRRAPLVVKDLERLEEIVRHTVGELPAY